MPANECKALHFYNDKFRDLINDKVGYQKDGSISFTEHVKKSLGLNKESDWSFICSSMDIINDSLLGIENFIRFGMGGPTKYNDSGEKYIRLYGVLNATYIQQQALLNLHQISNTPNLAEAKNKINSLHIRDVRNKLGAHSVDYENKDSKELESFVPVRITLGGMHCEYYNNASFSKHHVDLAAALSEHVSTMNDLYKVIYEKLAKTIYKTNIDIYTSLIDHLSDGQVIREGGVAIRNAEGELKFVTTFTEQP